MKLNYTISFADFKAAQRLHRHQKLGRRISFILLYVAVPVLAVLAGFAGLFLPARLQRYHLALAYWKLCWYGLRSLCPSLAFTKRAKV